MESSGLWAILEFDRNLSGQFRQLSLLARRILSSVSQGPNSSSGIPFSSLSSGVSRHFLRVPTFKASRLSNGRRALSCIWQDSVLSFGLESSPERVVHTYVVSGRFAQIPFVYQRHWYRASSTRPGCERLFRKDATALSLATVRWRGNRVVHCPGYKVWTSRIAFVAALSGYPDCPLSRRRFHIGRSRLVPVVPSGTLGDTCWCSDPKLES